MVGARGVNDLSTALSSLGCRSLRSLSLSHCCLGRQSRWHASMPCFARVAAAKAAHAAWDCFFRHVQRLPALGYLSLEHCGLQDCDVRGASIAVQILIPGSLRCLRLGRNSISASGLRTLIRALLSRRMALPALWMRRQRPPISEQDAKAVVANAFGEGLLAEVRNVDESTTVLLYRGTIRSTFAVNSFAVGPGSSAR